MKTLHIILGLCGTFALLGCDQAPEENASATTVTLPSLLVEADWLAEQIGKPGLVVLDVRSGANYEEGHISGAVSLFTNRTFHNYPKMDDFLCKGVSEIEKLLGQAGISNDIPIVLYGEGTGKSDAFKNAARMFWILEAHGHSRVAVLNGGIERWKAQGRPLVQEAPTITPQRFIARVTSERVATKQITKLAIDDPTTIIVDCRSTSQFLGEESITEAKGHIPSAVNVPWLENTQEDGAEGFPFKSREDLQRTYASILKGQRAIVYCNRGKQSAIAYLALRILEFDVRAYDGSWLQWSTDPDMPIEK